MQDEEQKTKVEPEVIIPIGDSSQVSGVSTVTSVASLPSDTNSPDTNVSDTSVSKTKVSSAPNNQKRTEVSSVEVKPIISEDAKDTNKKEEKDLTSRKLRKEDKKNKKNKKNARKLPDFSEFVTEGMNLIPPASKEVVAEEEKKGKFNIGGALAILLLVIVSIAIISYNIVQKQKLASIISERSKLEKEVLGYSDQIYKNRELLDRVNLYSEIQRESTSYKEIFEYWEDISMNLATIEEIKLGDDLGFSVNGRADSLMDVAKVWHFLSIDDRVVNVNLESFGKDGSGVSFIFNGTLNSEYFKSVSL